MYLDGYMNQLIESISNQIYELIKEKYNSVLQLVRDSLDEAQEKNPMEPLNYCIFNILKDYQVVVEVEEKHSMIPVLQPPDGKKVEALRKKRKYHIEQIVKDYNREKQDYREGTCKTKITPYCYIELEAKKEGRSEAQLAEEYDAKLEAWRSRVNKVKLKNSERVYLCDYPYIGFYSGKKLETFFEIDLAYNLLDLIDKDDLVEYAQLKPMTSVKSGMYFKTGKSTKKEGRTYDLDLPEMGENVVTFGDFVYQMEPDKQYINFVLDEKGSRLVNYLTTQCYKNYLANLSNNVPATLETSGTLKDIVKVLFPETKKPSQSHYEQAKKYMYNLGQIAIMKRKDANEKIRLSQKSIFDDIDLDIAASGNESLYFKVVLGQYFSKDILDMNISTIIKPTVNRLQGDIARLLYQDLKIDRIYDLMEGNNEPTVTHFYTINSLQLIARVTGSKSTRIKVYMKAFDELAEKKILISSTKLLSTGNVGIQVTWQPLSQTEYQDVLGINYVDVDKIEG